MRRSLVWITCSVVVAAGCAAGHSPAGDVHAGHAMEDSQAQNQAVPDRPKPDNLPASDAQAKMALAKSPRHGEWIEVAIPDHPIKYKAWIVYPETKEKAPVVLVIHEIFGLSEWVEAVADQLAAEGFIAIAPDFLSGKGANGGGTDSLAADEIRSKIMQIDANSQRFILDTFKNYAAQLPSAKPLFGVVGFCWGGTASFRYASNQPDLAAAVAYYGTAPTSKDDLAKIKAPVLGFYGGDDARVTATVEPTTALMKELSKFYEPHVFEGAGHGFLRQQDGRNGANLEATKQAWKRTIEFFKEHLK